MRKGYRIHWPDVAADTPWSAAECQAIWRAVAYKWDETTEVEVKESEDANNSDNDYGDFMARRAKKRSLEGSTSAQARKKQKTGDGESGGDDKPKRRQRRMWTKEEDLLLLNGVEAKGEGNWASIQRWFGLDRSPAQLAQRWIALKKKCERGDFSDERREAYARCLASPMSRLKREQPPKLPEMFAGIAPGRGQPSAPPLRTAPPSDGGLLSSLATVSEAVSSSAASSLADLASFSTKR
eukprot:TRINITY_DN5235_c0_g1_i3.p1 TRINITY_DN5235_c0_g1~~TRINITY_DN5235_c0_g1_i3.p1  ORF type:complete len:239 (-),score=48.89 TRINITY_DN5235_c0_g1_i3:215-931(-)